MSTTRTVMGFVLAAAILSLPPAEGLAHPDEHQHPQHAQQEQVMLEPAPIEPAPAGGPTSRATVREVPAVLSPPQRRVILQTSFEEGQPELKLAGHQVTDAKARTGKRSLAGQVTKEKQAVILEVPLKAQPNQRLQVEFYVWSEGRTGCAVWWKDASGRYPVTRLDNAPARWSKIEGDIPVSSDGSGVLQIVAPTSHGNPPGRMWVDDLTVTATDGPPALGEDVRSFPAIAYDPNSRTAYVAQIARPKGRLQVDLRTSREGPWTVSMALMDKTGDEPGWLTGLAAPAIAALPQGCILAAPGECEDRWSILCIVLQMKSIFPRVVMTEALDAGGTSNISPAIAVSGDTAHVVWESNAGNARGIYACAIGLDGRRAVSPRPAGDKSKAEETRRDAASTTRPEAAPAVVRLSAPDANSYNPTIVALADGSLFAAWDSLRDNSCDIYGAAFRDGKWQAERRLTSDARIERHPHLAACGNEVWMAWQAQSFKGIRINGVNEQRVVVARVDTDGLKMPEGLAKALWTGRTLLVRPRIVFDHTGRLWLSARQSMGQHAGWQAMLWRMTPGWGWSGPQPLLNAEGRWQPADLAAVSEGVMAVVQHDDLVQTGKTRGAHPGWKSEVAVVAAAAAATKRDAMEVEPLKMPETDFSLPAFREAVAADFPRLAHEHEGRKLTLFWGDLHDHTDLSICARSTNPPGHDLFANERDLERIDFCALTDHGYNFDDPQWAYNAEQTRNNHDEGRFVTFLGLEWTSSANPPKDPSKPVGVSNAQRYGHHNLIFLDPYHKRFYDAYDGDITPADLWKQIGNAEFICIPHELADWQHKGRGNPPTDWSFHDEKLQPVAEIFQSRESYEYFGCPRQSRTATPAPGHYYLQDAWAKGIVIGTIASPDHGGGMGKVGVWAEKLTRRDIFEALRRRRTYGTSGAKMGLFFRAGKAMMGDKVARPAGPITFQVRAEALREIKELVIWRNNKIVHRIEPDKKELQIEWTDQTPPDEKLLWYYVRIHCVDNELAWTSPIWFQK